MKARIFQFFVPLLLLALAFSCKSVPESAPVPGPADGGSPVDGVKPDSPTPPADSFDPLSVSQEVKQSTMIDVRSFIERLNVIISSRSFDEWTKHLTKEYLEHYSNREVLAEISQDPTLKRYGLVLKDLRDYFNYVVFPSRRDSQVDDIEFLDKSRIKVIWISPKGERLVLYNLEKIGDTWKIAIWR